MLWNLASRSPGRLLRDIGAGVLKPATAVVGIARAAGGLFLLAGGAVLLLPLAIGSRTYLVLETWTVLSGLLVEQLIGADARRRSS